MIALKKIFKLLLNQQTIPSDLSDIVDSLRVDYKQSDGWHIFTSIDLPGLCVASTDIHKAYKDVFPSIEQLIFLNTGIIVRVQEDGSL